MNPRGFATVREMRTHEEYYFPAQELLIGDFCDIREGDFVSFCKDEHPGSSKIFEVYRINSPLSQYEPEYSFGTVSRTYKGGFGFIDVDNSRENNLYFHANEVEDSLFDKLKKGTKVQFIIEVSSSKRGANEAKQVKVLRF